jgi:two-component system, LuxR family, sensor kinase FixL
MADPSTSKPAYRKVVAALAESEERYRILVEGVRRYAIFMLDPAGIILTWNRGMQELLGYDRDEIVGQSGAVLFSAAGTFRKELAQAKTSDESIAEHLNIHRDGSEIRVHDTTTSLRNLKGRLIGFAKVVHHTDPSNDRKDDASAIELAKALARIEVEVEHRRRLEAQLLTAVEQERERLGRDLHDDLSQRLAGAALMTRTLAKELKGRSAADREKARALGDLLAEATSVARNLSRGLHPITLTANGLPKALEELAARVPQNVRFNWPKSKKLDLDPSVALHIYRIAEEAVGNAVRHAQAKSITIELHTTPGRKIALAITDDGKGLGKRRGPEGMGLQNMRYRARVIRGTLKIASAPNRGTVVTCILPLQRSLMPRATS